MHLVIDAVGNKRGGGAIVLLELLRAALAAEELTRVTVLASPISRRTFDFPTSAKLNVKDIAMAESAPGRIMWALRGLEHMLARLRPDLFLGLNGLGPVRSCATSGVFIQQAAPYSKEALALCPKTLRIRLRIIKALTRRSARAAARIMVQTIPMRETIAEAFALPRERISVFLPGSPHLPVPTGTSPKLAIMRDNMHRRALLYVGDNEPYKNLGVVELGMQLLGKQFGAILYVTLPSSAEICRSGAAVSLGKLTRAELAEAYAHASVLIMPSVIETVGLPMLEGMACGVPVLAADRPYAHAVCGDAALYFDPTSSESFIDNAVLILGDTLLRKSLISRGKSIVASRNLDDPYIRMVESLCALKLSTLT